MLLLRTIERRLERWGRKGKWVLYGGDRRAQWAWRPFVPLPRLELRIVRGELVLRDSAVLPQSLSRNIKAVYLARV